MNVPTPDWGTVKSIALRAGLEVLCVAEAAWATLNDPKCPRQAKIALGAALAYLVLPLDAIPDFLPFGFVDDLGVILAALPLAAGVGQQHYAAARSKYGLSEEDINGKTGGQ